jgi:hypothetical protein
MTRSVSAHLIADRKFYRKTHQIVRDVTCLVRKLQS